MKPLPNKLEAVLFSSRGAQPTASLLRLLDVNKDDLTEALRALSERYAAADGALEIRYEDGGYLLALKPHYYGTVRQLIPVPIRDAVLATLTHIAREQPVAQSTIIDLRGQKAYNHIRDLVELGWVSKKRAGATYLLKTTKKFAEVFQVTDDPERIRHLIEDAALPYLADDVH